jgi:CDP-diglyceride synthetase
MKKRYLVIFLRLFFGLLTFTAIIVQIIHVVDLHAFNPVNFFSYFTNLSNIFAGFVLVASAMYLAGSRKPSATDDLVRGAVTMYMVITGVVYSLLLSGYELGHLLPWVNIVLHYIMPIVVLADWLCQPQRTKKGCGGWCFQCSIWCIRLSAAQLRTGIRIRFLIQIKQAATPEWLPTAWLFC